jgi:hypothetical protein
MMLHYLQGKLLKASADALDYLAENMDDLLETFYQLNPTLRQ